MHYRAVQIGTKSQDPVVHTGQNDDLMTVTNDDNGVKTKGRRIKSSILACLFELNIRHSWWDFYTGKDKNLEKEDR